jgi:GTP-binding protein
MLKIQSADFIISCAKISQIPETNFPEFAFIGRSNVGKSSLINTLTERTKLVKVAKRPGTTQLINYFEINNEFYFVDLPGYGYARAPKSEKTKWSKKYF